MSVQSSIGWADEVWNPIRGCQNRCSATEEHPEGNCYAAEMCRRQMTKCVRCHNHLDVHFHPERLEQPTHWRRPRRVFLGSMTDLWGGAVDPVWRQAIWGVVRSTPQHTYIALTKRPSAIIASELVGLRNLIVGMSESWWAAPIERFARDTDAWIQSPELPRVCVSLEPLRESTWDGIWKLSLAIAARSIEWVIIGAATGAVARMYPPNASALETAVLGITEMADSMDKPVFLKDNLRPYISAELFEGHQKVLRIRRGTNGPSPQPSPGGRGGNGPSPQPSPGGRGGNGPSPQPSPGGRGGNGPSPPISLTRAHPPLRSRSHARAHGERGERQRDGC